MMSFIQQENPGRKDQTWFSKKKLLELIETLHPRTLNWEKNFKLKTFEDMYYQMIAFPERNFFGILLLPVLF